MDNYDDLKVAIESHLDRDDLTENIDDFIDLAEARHRREVRFRQMLTREPLTVDSRYVDLPDGYLEAKSLRLLTDRITVLEDVTQDYMNRVRRESNGKPSYFTVNNDFEFDVVPDSAYSGEILFFKELTPISDANPTNELLTTAPDVYLYAALLASAPFLLNDERIAVWGGFYSSAIEALGISDRRGRRIGPQVARVSGATP